MVSLLLSPGWLLFLRISPHLQTSGWDLRPLLLVVQGNFVYYFGLIFAFAFYADRRWRQKRAARIDA